LKKEVKKKVKKTKQGRTTDFNIKDFGGLQQLYT
jgi:hypothetical protein